MQRFSRVASILGLDREIPQVGDVFVRDSIEQREAEAESRRLEFERFAESGQGRMRQEQSTSHMPVRQDRLSIVSQAMSGGRAPGEPLGLDAYHMSSRSVKRAGIEEEPEGNFGAPTDPTMLGSMHMFQSREAYERQFDDLAEQDQARREARRARASRDDRRKDAWEGSVAERVAELMAESRGMASDVMMDEDAPMSASDIRGGTVRAIGGAEAPDRPFGLVNYDAAGRRDASVVDMRQARVARQEAISRARDEHQRSVNDDLVSKMRSSSIQQQSIDGGGLAARVAAAMQKRAFDGDTYRGPSRDESEYDRLLHGDHRRDEPFAEPKLIAESRGIGKLLMMDGGDLVVEDRDGKWTRIEPMMAIQHFGPEIARRIGVEPNPLAGTMDVEPPRYDRPERDDPLNPSWNPPYHERGM